MSRNMSELGFKAGDTVYHVLTATVNKWDDLDYEPYADDYYSTLDWQKLNGLTLGVHTCDACGLPMRAGDRVEILGTATIINSEDEEELVTDKPMITSVMHERCAPKRERPWVCRYCDHLVQLNKAPAKYIGGCRFGFNLEGCSQFALARCYEGHIPDTIAEEVHRLKTAPAPQHGK